MPLFSYSMPVVISSILLDHRQNWMYDVAMESFLTMLLISRPSA
jgi:hypothetical protein